jgi:repressor LexA
LMPSDRPGTLRTHVRIRQSKRLRREVLMVELNLTKRQREIFEYVKRYGEEHGYPPTVRDIGKAIGLTSSSTVHAHLANLEKLGLLRRDPTKPRAIEVLVDKAKAAVAPAGLPVVGQVAAGRPVLAEENIEEYIPVPQIAGGDEGGFVLRVKGDSMVKAGIFEGDYVIVRPQETAADGEIVVALVEDEATVKRFYREQDHVRLQPENDALEPIRSRDVQVLGRVVGVCRRVS